MSPSSTHFIVQVGAVPSRRDCPQVPGSVIFLRMSSDAPLPDANIPTRTGYVTLLGPAQRG